MRRHGEYHRAGRLGWLRAAVLGANDGVISTASLMLGVAAAEASAAAVLLAGMAGLAAGALSMAAGEYVSVSSQADSERADLDRERKELADDPAAELAELAALQQARGLSPELAQQVAVALTAHDALAAHAQDELGLGQTQLARPLRAAIASAAAFAIGAAMPLPLAVFAPEASKAAWIVIGSLVCLVLSGAVAARPGGAAATRGAFRMVACGALAMAGTWLVGAAFGVAV
jgi:vacuolar iron transporter family protein